MKKQKRIRGFTIVELIIVLVMVAILASVLIPTITNYIEKAKNAKVVANAKSTYIAYQQEIIESHSDVEYFIYTEDNGKTALIINGSVQKEIYDSRNSAIMGFLEKIDKTKADISKFETVHFSGGNLLGITSKGLKNIKINNDINSDNPIHKEGVILINQTKTSLENDKNEKIVEVTVPKNSVLDTSKEVKLSITSIDPNLTINLGEDEKAIAYDIHVENIKEKINDGEEIIVELAAPKALPSVNLYHNGEKINCDYDARNGLITFKTKSFSPFALSYIEKTANTLDELREYTAIDNAYVKIGSNIKINFDGYQNWDAETVKKNIKHAITISSGQMGVYDVPGYEEYRVAFCGVYVTGKNVTVDLNGHEILLRGHPKQYGAMFFVSEGTLNLTDSVGGGKAKVACSTYIVWSSWTRNTGTFVNIYDGIYMADTFTGDTDPNYGYKSKFNSAMIYAGYNNEQYGNVNVYGGYYLYNNFPSDDKNTNNGAFNVGDSTTRVCLTVHDGVYLINEHWRQSTGTDDDSVALADGCKVEQITLGTPIVIDGESYDTWYKVVTDIPRFKKVFENTEAYLYRVGNGNDIKLGSLFKPTSYNSSITSGASVNVQITTIEGNVIGAYTIVDDSANWMNHTIKFTNTGVVKVNINGCELLLEVVDGKNATNQSDLSKAGNIVLLNDINFTTEGNYVLENKTLFGNGFTINYNELGKKSEHIEGVIDLRNSTLDNVKIIGDKYKTFNDTSSQEYYAATVIVRGDSKITNSYIANGQVALRVNDGAKLFIENTTLYGGRYANAQIKGGLVTLKDVTTIQEKNVIDGETCLGFGIIVWEGAGTSTRINVEGTLTQNNWANQKDKKYLPGTAENYVDTAFRYNQFVYTYNNEKYVNLGIISISSNVLSDKIIIPDSINYSKQDLSGTACVVTCDKNKNNTLLNGGIPEIIEWTPTTQGAFVPSFEWNYPQGYNETSNEVVITFEQGQSHTLNHNFLTSTKHGRDLEVRVTMNNTDYTNKNINFTTAGVYVLEYIVKDPYNYSATLAKTDILYTFEVKISVIVNAPDVKHASFSYTSGSGFREIEINGKTYIMPNVNSTSSTIASKTIGGETIYMPIVTAQYKDNKSERDFDAYSPIFTAINIIDYSPATSAGVATIYNTSTKTMPTNLIYTGTGPTAPHLNGCQIKDGPMTYSSYGLCYRGVKGADIKDTTQTVEYCYTDNAGQAYYYYIQYYFPAHNKPTGCFTPDTLITLANGTQKRIDEINFNDKILAWDFFTGRYVEKNISILVNHGYDNYDVVYTKYSDGTLLKTIAEHGIFDYDLNKFVYIDSTNVNDFVGHRFVKYSDDGNYNVVTMIEGYIQEEYTEAWSVSSAITSNAFASGLLTVAPPEDFYNWISMADKLMYDVEEFNRDVETYGLYTYDDFKDYVTYEQFIDWNGAYLKIPVEKGYFTFEYILELIELYKEWFKY